jgi:peptide methionine sulfoxide reductase msrA/msrB
MLLGRNVLLAVLVMAFTACGRAEDIKMNPLTPQEERVIVNKGTEAPFTGEYYNFHGKGTYVCKRCGTALYRSETKFDSGCGWPSFDDELPGAVKRSMDADGMRTEITCAKCGAHLGHVFLGEGLTVKNTRHCVNSISLKFVEDVPAVPAVVPPAAAPEAPAVPAPAPKPATETAIFAGGCFWGVEYYFQKARGVLSTQVGYIGGTVARPTYEQVCSGTTGHAEAIRVTYDPAQTSFEEMSRLFFETHDPTQVNRQGPDIGLQYRSAVFYQGEAQKETTERLIGLLKAKGFNVATQVVPAGTFWPAEDYHQQYYDKKGQSPYCHVYTKRF